jgi:hypothetical protein
MPKTSYQGWQGSGESKSVERARDPRNCRIRESTCSPPSSWSVNPTEKRTDHDHLPEAEARRTKESSGHPTSELEKGRPRQRDGGVILHSQDTRNLMNWKQAANQLRAPQGGRGTAATQTALNAAWSLCREQSRAPLTPGCQGIREL